MNKYTRKDRDFNNIELEDSRILGFQQVKTDPSKVFVWFRQVVERPNYQDRHKTTRVMNNTQRKHDWAKSVWTIENVFKHLGSYLATKVTKEEFYNLQDDSKSDKWITADGTSRNFLKLLIDNPISDVTEEPLNIQITQQSGIAFDSVYVRALEESNAGEGIYEDLLHKYKERSVVKTYTKDLKDKMLVSKLREVFAMENGIKLRVFEDSELVFGDANSIFIDYKVNNNIPLDYFKEDREEVSNIENVVEKSLDNV